MIARSLSTFSRVPPSAWVVHTMMNNNSRGLQRSFFTQVIIRVKKEGERTQEEEEGFWLVVWRKEHN